MLICTPLGTSRAQRLAASKMESDQLLTILTCTAEVLNALRHRRWNQLDCEFNEFKGELCSTPCGIEDGISLVGQTIKTLMIWCSTPCGIEDGIRRELCNLASRR